EASTPAAAARACATSSSEFRPRLIEAGYVSRTMLTAQPSLLRPPHLDQRNHLRRILGNKATLNQPDARVPIRANANPNNFYSPGPSPGLQLPPPREPQPKSRESERSIMLGDQISET